MEKEYSINFSYANASAGTTFPSASPIDSSVKRYNLSIENQNSNSYTLRATPISGTTQADDGRLELDHLGRRFWDKNNDGDVTDVGENNWNP